MQRWAQFWGLVLFVALQSTASTTKPRRSLFVSRHAHGERGLEQPSNNSLDEGERAFELGADTGKTDAAKDLFGSNRRFPSGSGMFQPQSSNGYGQIGQSIGYPQPSLGPSISYSQPNLGQSIGYQPNLGSSLGYQPSLGSSVGYQPNLGPSLGYQPNLGSSLGYQPYLGPSIGYQPVLGPSIGYQPSLAPLGQSSSFGPYNSVGPQIRYKPAGAAGQLPQMSISPIGRPNFAGADTSGQFLPAVGNQFYGSQRDLVSMNLIPSLGGAPTESLENYAKSYASAARTLSSVLQAQMAADGSENSAARAYISPGTYYPTFQGNPFAPPPFFGPPTPSGTTNAIFPPPMETPQQQPFNLIPQQQPYSRNPLRPLNLFPTQQQSSSLLPVQQQPYNLVPQQQQQPYNLVPQTSQISAYPGGSGPPFGAGAYGMSPPLGLNPSLPPQYRFAAKKELH